MTTKEIRKRIKEKGKNGKTTDLERIIEFPISKEEKEWIEANKCDKVFEDINKHFAKKDDDWFFKGVSFNPKDKDTYYCTAYFNQYIY